MQPTIENRFAIEPKGLNVNWKLLRASCLGTFGVPVQEDTDLRNFRKRLGVPTDLAACHTAEAGGYVIEEHVPAAAIQRLLKERPVATGVAVPGMPVVSPVMEVKDTPSFSSGL